MEWLIAVVLLLCTFGMREGLNPREGFNPTRPDERPPGYPDQSYSAPLIEAQKHLQKMLETPSDKSPYLEDLLMLLQWI